MSARAAAPLPYGARVLIAGGGFAAVEAMLALRELAGERVTIDVVSLHRRFAYRPSATGEPFDDVPPLAYDLAEIAEDLGARHRVDRVEAVAPAVGHVRLASGARLAYDTLVLAFGAQLRTSVAGALMFTGQRDVAHIRNLLDELTRGAVHDVVFAVPAGVSWPLPLYELALLTGGFVRKRGLAADVSIVTPERAPLEVFGERAGALVRELLDECGVRFLARRTPDRVHRDGRLTLRWPAAELDADRVIAVPNMVGREIPGIPRSLYGFVPTDDRGRVYGLEDVYAAGDMTTYPIKQGGLAAQQADAIAADIAARVSRAPAPEPRERVLSARLIGGPRPVELHVTLDGAGRARDARIATLAPGEVPPVSEKVFGRYLVPYLRRRRPADAAVAV